MKCQCSVIKIIVIGLLTMASQCYQFQISNYCEILEDTFNKTYFVCPLNNIISDMNIQSIIAEISDVIYVEDNCTVVNSNEMNFNQSKAGFENCSFPLHSSMDHEILQLREVSSNDTYSAVNAIQPVFGRSGGRNPILDNITLIVAIKGPLPLDKKIVDDYLKNIMSDGNTVFISMNNPNLDILSNKYGITTLGICCNMTSLDTTVFAEHDKIQSLELSEHNFEHLTKQSFLGVGQLEELKLVRNNIQSIDEDVFAQVTKLSKVFFKYNRIAAIPKGLFVNNKNLQLFEMLCDDIQILPDELFANTPLLMHFIMRCNMISVPKNLFAGSLNITIIDLSSNALKMLPPRVFKNLRNLQSLQLDYNFLTTLPELIFNDVENLTVLKLSNNRFTTIYSLSNSALNWQAIRYIDLSYNNISAIADDYYTFVQHDAKVNLSSNAIAEVNVSKIINIKQSNGKFILAHNPFNCTCGKIRQITELLSHPSHPFQIDGLKCDTPVNMSNRYVSSINFGDLLCKYPPAKGCRMLTDENYQNMIMNCSNANLTEVPKWPVSSKFDFKELELHIDHNYITKLPNFNTTLSAHITKIFASNNLIENVIPENIPRKLTTLDLSNNRLKGIGRTTAKSLNATSLLQNISLGGNPWICDCDRSDSIVSLSLRIQDSNDMKCKGGSEDSQLVTKFAGLCMAEYTKIIIITASFAIIFAIILSALYYHNREVILVWLYAHNIRMCCISEDALDRDKQYDAFLSISPGDDDFAFDNLLHELECGPITYRICWPIRDWIVGEYINQLIMDSVKNSCRTIILLTPNFLKSVWGRMESRTAHQNAMKDGISRIIVILCGGIGDVKNLDPVIQSYLKTNTFLIWGEPRFFDKLRYALPHRKRTSDGCDTSHKCFHFRNMTEHQPDLLTNTGKKTLLMEMSTCPIL